MSHRVGGGARDEARRGAKRVSCAGPWCVRASGSANARTEGACAAMVPNRQTHFSLPLAIAVKIKPCLPPFQQRKGAACCNCR